MYSAAIRLLERDRLLYADMINLLVHRDECDGVELISADERGVILSMENGETHMTALFEPESARHLLSLLPEPKLVTCHQEWSEPIIEEMFGPISDNTRCIQLAYTGDRRLPVELHGMKIRPLTAEHLSLAAENYDMGDMAYLADRMEKGQLFGGFVNGDMVGFIGIHSETSIGMLEVLPQYRRKGYGRALESCMVNYQLDRGYIPYGQVVLGNQPSMALQNSLGFEQADGVVSWMTTRFSPSARAWDNN